MKKSILSFLVYIIGVSPVLAQTYQELSDRAIACTEQDSLAQAENYIRQALKLEPANPHNALLFSNLGTIQRRQRDYDQALESYTYALNIAPRAVPILLNRAALNLEMGRNEQARVDYSLVLDLEKDNREALLMRAYIYVTQRDLKFARADYERLLKSPPSKCPSGLPICSTRWNYGDLIQQICCEAEYTRRGQLKKTLLQKLALTAFVKMNLRILQQKAGSCTAPKIAQDAGQATFIRRRCGPGFNGPGLLQAMRTGILNR